MNRARAYGIPWVRRSWVVACCGVVLLAAACDLAPPIRLPQVEGVQRAVREPREERAHVYQRCLQDALREAEGDQDDLLACMEAAGFGFLAKSAEHRRSYCVTALETPGVFPEAYCFQKLE